MKKGKMLLILALALILRPLSVLAHPGRTDSNGCHTCKTNCEKYGLSYGEYHCHNGNSNSSSGGSNKNTYKKSSIKTLSFVKVNNDSVAIRDKMNYVTSTTDVTVEAAATDNKANVEIDWDQNLEYGDNQILIIVTAEDGSTKKYVLNIKLVSNDANLKIVKVDNEEIAVENSMTYRTIKSDVEITAIANNESANIEYDKNPQLEIGENIIKIKITAADKKTTKYYNLKIVRVEKYNDNVNVKIKVNGEKVIFNNYKSNTIYLDFNIKEINIEYKLEDENATIELDYDKRIESGDKIIKFKVISESGKEQEYEINIHKYSESEENVNTIIGLGVTGGIGYGIYKWRKKKSVSR